MAGIESGTGYLALALPFIAAALAPLLTKRLGQHACWPLALAPAIAFVIFLQGLPGIAEGQVSLFGFDWIATFDVRFSFRIDGLASTFALLITGIGTLIVLYSGGYLAGHRDQGRFFSFMLMFMGSMLGLVVSDDLITLFVYWELTSITSFLLIGFDHHREAARRGAIQALVITGGGGLALLAGLIMIRELTGLSSMTDVLSAGDTLRNSVFYAPILILVLCGAFTKSAQMPFHVWLPNAMEAPTPVSAYLHSATMVKAGVYLLLRMQPALGETALWTTILPAFGAVTLVIGALLAVKATDIKITLAYTTVASLGLLVMLIGVGTEEAIAGAVLYLIAHSLFKGGLFMVAGSVDHGAHTRELSGLGGLRRAMPITFAAALLCALSMGGLTPFVGFLAKETMYHALEHGDAYHVAIMAAAIAGNALMFAAAFIVALKPFLGTMPRTIDHPHEGDPTIWLGPLALGVLGLAGALFYGSYHEYLSIPMASSAVGRPVAIDIGWVPHFNLAFALSLLTIAIGVGLYRVSERLRAAIVETLRAIGWGPDHGFDQAMRGLVRFSFALTRTLQSGRLDYYMTVTVIAIVAGLFVPMIWAGALPAMPAFPSLALFRMDRARADPPRHRRRRRRQEPADGDRLARHPGLRHGADLHAARRAGPVLHPVHGGDAVGGHPGAGDDPAETLGRRPPALARGAARRGAGAGRRGGLRPVAAVDRPAAVRYGAVGLFRALQLPDRPRPQHRQCHHRRLPRGGHDGRDRRRHDHGPRDPGADPHPRRTRPRQDPRSDGGDAMRTLIFRFTAPYITSLMVLFSIFVLLRGHNEPGGGFIGGLIAASAFAIYGIACGVAPVRRALYFHPMAIAGSGLMLAVLAGLLSAVFDTQFMTGLWVFPQILGGEVALSTPMFFDIGVYLVVVGGISSIALALEERESD